MGSGDDSLEIPPARIDHRRKISADQARHPGGARSRDDGRPGCRRDVGAAQRLGHGPSRLRFGAFENAAITGSQGLTLIGDGGDNVLRAFGCNVKADGGAGDDALSVFPGLMTGDVVPCAPTARTCTSTAARGRRAAQGLRSRSSERRRGLPIPPTDAEAVTSASSRGPPQLRALTGLPPLGCLVAAGTLFCGKSSAASRTQARREAWLPGPDTQVTRRRSFAWVSLPP